MARASDFPSCERPFVAKAELFVKGFSKRGRIEFNALNSAMFQMCDAMFKQRFADATPTVLGMD
jgi:hypothetical protein